MKRLRAFLESIVFADLKPGFRPEQTPGKKKWYTPLSQAWERMLSGGAAQRDPLYLTNRTLGQKVRVWAMIAAPCLVVIGFVALSLSNNFFNPPEAVAPKEMSPEEVSRKLLPNISRDITIETNRDADIVEVRVDHNEPLKLIGSIRNNTATHLRGVDVVFNLTDKTGSQVGAVNGHIDDLGPKAVRTFQFPILQTNAVFALVREVNSTK